MSTVVTDFALGSPLVILEKNPAIKELTATATCSFFLANYTPSTFLPSLWDRGYAEKLLATHLLTEGDDRSSQQWLLETGSWKGFICY